MAILKQKIAQAKASKLEKIRNPVLIKPTPVSKKQKLIRKESLPKKRRRLPGSSFTPEETRSTKNIVKNFGRAICAFASSHLAFPYLRVMLEKNGLSLNFFINYVNELKKRIDGLFKFRSLLMREDRDNDNIKSAKEVFQGISEVFIKYFSVNWIFHGKILHKDAHLKFRFKILRRIKAPEKFTYLKESKKTIEVS